MAQGLDNNGMYVDDLLLCQLSLHAINSKLTPLVGTNNFYCDIFTSQLIIFTNCESVINKNIFTASPIYGICWQYQNPVLSLTDKNDVFNGFNFLKSPSVIKHI